MNRPRRTWNRARTKTSADSSPYPDDEDIDFSDIPETDFSNAVHVDYSEWYKRGKGKFREVTDEEDARRTPAERRPSGLLKKLSQPKR